jgi:hypothetical protein
MEELTNVTETQKVEEQESKENKFSDHLVFLGLLSRDEKGSLVFTDLGKRTLRTLRFLDGKINYIKNGSKKVKAIKKAPLKRNKKTVMHIKYKAGAKPVRRSARPLNLRQKGPIFNHRLATFIFANHAKELVSKLNKGKVDATIRPTLDGKRSHVIIPYSKVHEALPILKAFRESAKAGAA